MDKSNAKNKNVFQQMLDDKRCIRKCIRSNGDLKQLAQKHGFKFATPI